MLPESPSVAPGWLLPLNEISRLPMLCGSRPPPSWSLRPSVFFCSIFFSKFSRLTSFADQRQPSLPLFFLPIIWPWLIDLLFFLQAVFKRLVLALCFLNFLFHPLLPILLVDHLLSRRLRSRCCDCCWPAGATDLTGDDQGHRPMRGHPSSCPCRPWPPPTPPASGWAVSRLKKVPPQVSAFVNPFSSS